MNKFILALFFCLMPLTSFSEVKIKSTQDKKENDKNVEVIQMNNTTKVHVINNKVIAIQEGDGDLNLSSDSKIEGMIINRSNTVEELNIEIGSGSESSMGSVSIE